MSSPLPRWIIPFLLFLAAMMFTLAGLLANTVQTVQALPEYATQVGEPCGSCHVSPSGGGARTPRGTAWVAGGKPGVVPDTVAALALLGVKVDADLSQYTTVSEKPAPAVEITPASGADAIEIRKMQRWLREYQGN